MRIGQKFRIIVVLNSLVALNIEFRISSMNLDGQKMHPYCLVHRNHHDSEFFYLSARDIKTK